MSKTLEVEHCYGGGASSSSKLLPAPAYKKLRLPEGVGRSYGVDELMFIYLGCRIYITVPKFVERLHPLLQLLISRAALSSSTVSNGLTFRIKSSFLKYF